MYSTYISPQRAKIDSTNMNMKYFIKYIVKDERMKFHFKITNY